MEKGKYIYSETFPNDSKVKITNRSMLENFLKMWTLHNKLKPEQLSHADQISEVESVGFYRGGDELYKLKGISGIWHKQCLEAVASETKIIPNSPDQCPRPA
jgi:hypothetical protein